MSSRIVLDHGSGGRQSRDLVRSLFQSRLGNAALNAETDAAVLPLIGNDQQSAGDRSLEGQIRVAMTTDAHVVKPLVFPGGDIGRLAVCGTVNDLVVAGADARYITAAFIIEEGFELGALEAIVDSMAAAAEEAGVRVVAGDTKVVGRGECDGLFITTTGVGLVPSERSEIASASSLVDGDVILVNGPIGDHGAAIACIRNGIDTDPPLLSDCAPLSPLVRCLYDAGIVPHFMRDATRGGLATVLCELAELAHVGMDVREEAIPVRDAVRGVCEIYGFDPLYLANEGTMICVVGEADGSGAVAAMQGHPAGRSAAAIGTIRTGGAGDKASPRAIMNTTLGGSRILRMLAGEQLPRIC